MEDEFANCNICSTAMPLVVAQFGYHLKPKVSMKLEGIHDNLAS
jgi:hypothetical protein